MLLTMLYRLLICFEVFVIACSLAGFVVGLDAIIKEMIYTNGYAICGFSIASTIAALAFHYIFAQPIKTKLEKS